VTEEREQLWNGDRAFVETRIKARGKGSGIEVAETYYTVWTIENGMGTVMEIHVDPDRALQSVLPSDRWRGSSQTSVRPVSVGST
jgi:hypothetical protein